MKRYKPLIILFLVYSYTANAINKDLVKKLNNNNQKIALDYLKKPVKHTKSYLLKQQIFDLARKKYKGLKFLDFKKWYAANFFYSMQNMVNTNLKKSSNKIKFFKGYNKEGDRPLQGYITAKNKATNFSVLDLKHENLRRIQMTLLSKKSISSHKLMVLALDKAWRRNSENIEDHQLGTGRNHAVGWGGGFVKEKFHRMISHKKIFKNKVWSKPENPFVKHHSSSWTAYLNPADHFDMQKCLAYKVGKDICNRIKNNIPKYRVYSKEKELGEDYQKWLIGYVNFAIETLKTSLKNAKTNFDVVKAAATFHYHLVSIHTFSNGNGRTTRVMTEKILEEYNLPAPIHHPFGIDVTFALNDFVTIIGDAVALSIKFHEDLLLFLQNDIPYGYVSSHLLAPGWFPYKLFGDFKINPKEFMAWLMQYSSQEAIKNKYMTITDAVKKFQRWRKKASPDDLKRMFIMTFLPKDYRN